MGLAHGITMHVPRTRLLSLVAAATGLAVIVACASGRPPATAAEPAPPPLTGIGSAFAAAAEPALASTTPLELPGLHNVFRLSERFVSGSEPHGEAAFAELQRLGVRTILSVDGSPPDVATAQRYGMLYVHVPIQYKGITDDEALRIAKTFRELPGPFYVHCFHGKHRGPAAAALGRCLVDGVSRQQAIAEMRQWMGTAAEYEGLYQTIATSALPAAAQTQALRWDFPSTHRPDGFVAAMVDLGRVADNLKDAARREFAADPAHPDVDAFNEARKLQSLLTGCLETKPYLDGKDDFRQWLEANVGEAAELVSALATVRGGGPDAADAVARASRLVAQAGKTCKACHKAYRDN